jgi:SAM-dependent methyltransferase
MVGKRLLRKLFRAVTSQYFRVVVEEILQWRHGRVVRNRALVTRQYRLKPGVNLDAPTLGRTPEGTVTETPYHVIRSHNWKLITDMLVELGATRGIALEVGAGDGTDVRAMRRMLPAISWHGCDLNPRIGNREIIPADAVHLPFRTGTADVVVTSHVLEQMPDVAPALQEIARVTKQWLISVEPDYERGSWMQRLYMIRKDYVRDIVNPAAAAGFTLVRREWAYAGNPLNRPSIFVFRKQAP